MKIGLIIYGALDTLSGGYLYDRQLVAHLRRAGCQVDIISLPWRNYVAHLGDNFNRRWAAEIVAARYDLLLQDELNHPSLAWLNDTLQGAATGPIISIVHHLRSQESHPSWVLPLYRKIESRYLRSVDGFIYNSRTTRQTVETIVGGDRPGHIAYPAADHIHHPTLDQVLDRIHERESSQGPLQLIFVGNLIARKGLHTLLPALQPLSAHTWHLHIVGNQKVDIGYTKRLRGMAVELDIEPQLSWHGRVSDHDLGSLLMRADCFVLPSYEGFGIAYLEAMAFGLPVIALTAGAAHEIVKHAQNGFLIEPDDTLALTTHVRTLAQDRSLLGYMARRARETYDNHPTWQQSMTAAIQWLHEFVRNHADRRP